MIDAWWIGPAVLATMAATVAVAAARRHRHRASIAIAGLVAGAWYATAWAIARAAMRGHAGAFESAFLQLAFASVAAFLFAVVAMIAAWRRGRSFTAETRRRGESRSSHR